MTQAVRSSRTPQKIWQEIRPQESIKEIKLPRKYGAMASRLRPSQIPILFKTPKEG